MTTCFENEIKTFDGETIFFQSWRPEKTIQSTIIIFHGQAEHSDCYSSLIPYLSDQSTQIIGWDLRGHGKSSGKRGYVSSFSNYSKDFKILIEKKELIDLIKGHLYIFAHSMGALVLHDSFSYFSEFDLKGIILSSPLFGLKMPVPGWKTSIAKVVANLTPTLTMSNEIDFNYLTSDLEIIKKYEKDFLRHDRISSQVYLGFLERFPNIKKWAQNITCPLLMQLGVKDPMIDLEIAKDFVSYLPHDDFKLKIYNQSKHEIYNDIEREKAIEDLKTFIQ